ncbi:MAG: beta-ketoacyl synthase N-terminal-like domain-containing protein, partial [Burkholderiaceae bacterium]
MRRVAVSGLGLVCPLGDTAAAVYAAAHDGRSAVNRLERPFATRLVAPLGATARFDPTPHFEPARLRMLDRVAQMALVATRTALADAGLTGTALADPARGGVFVGTGMAGTLSNDDGYHTLYGEASDRIKPYTVLLGMHNASAGWISIEQGWTGPSLTYSTACSSSAVAIGEASLRIARGELDLALAGGAEAPLSFGSLKAWEALHTLAGIDPGDAARSCKPFAKNRSGMVLGEGAAMLVLEPWERAIARGVLPLGELLGYGLTTDAGHITRPSAAGQAQAMRAAL